MKKFNVFKSAMYSLVLTILAVLLGDASNVVMATTGTLTDGLGGTAPGSSTNGTGDLAATAEGTQTLTRDEQAGDEDYLDKEIDRKITKIRPMSTPVDQISRMADASSSKQMEFKYFSIGTRPIKTTLTVTSYTQPSNVSQQTLSGSLVVGDASIFTADDTFRIVGVKATHQGANAYAESLADSKKPDLICKVITIDSNGLLVVHAVNGDLDSSNQPTLIPTIEDGTYTIIRMGKACGELDVQTGRFANIPASEEQYCQNFMMQVEQSTFDQMADKNVDWNFSDMEEDSAFDMRLGMEGSYLFGDKAKIAHSTKANMYTWFTGGIWWMAGQDLELGHWDATLNNNAGGCVISDDDLVEFAKDAFVGTGCGNKRKIMLCGSNVLAALSKVKSEKFRLKDTVEVWDLKFKSWDTDFGEILTMHHELFDMNDMKDSAFLIDPEYLSKKKFISWTRNVLDLKSAGIRNTNAIVLQEASALYLRYPMAHARVTLVTSA